MADFSFAPNHDHMTEAERAHPTMGTYCSFDVIKADTGYGGSITGFVAPQVRDLLLAAPDLLAAVKDLLTFHQIEIIQDGVRQPQDPRVERALAVVAKAENRS